MEDVSTISEATPSVAETKTSNVDSFEMGGASDSTSQLGWVAIMMLGLTGASLIYSIFYYKKRLEALRNGDNILVSQMKKDIQEMKEKIDTLSGKRIRNGKLA